ncbi:MAG: CsgG/HfaB family protein [bacterium]
MKTRLRTSDRIRRAALAAAVLILAAGPAVVRAQGSMPEKLEPVLGYYAELEFDKGIELASGYLDDPGLTSQDRIAIYSLLSMLTFAKGEQYMGRSYSYLEKIAEIGPCVIPLPSDYWPQNLRDRWYRIARDAGALVCPEPSFAGAVDAPADRPRTVAVMEFDNFSVGKYQEKLGYLTKGLADFFEADFAQVSTLRVVERDKIAFIRDELMLNKDGLVDQAAAVKIGKLLGAQVMIFGSVVQMDDKQAKMIVKAVDVETSRILAFAERDGKPDFFRMQEDMVIEMAEKLEPLLEEEQLRALKANGTEDEEAAALYSQGLYYMDSYQYARAYDYFKQAYDRDASFVEAKRKMDVYRPLALAG